MEVRWRSCFQVAFFINFITKKLKNQRKNKEKYDPTTLPNWENTSNDGDRFAPQQSNFGSGNKSLDSYDSYLKKKAIRETAKKAAKQKVEDLKKTVPNPHTIIV